MVLYFLWAGRSVEVVTSGSRVAPRARRVSGVARRRRIFLRPGRYDLVVERKSYAPLHRAIAVSDATGKFEFVLQKLPGRLRVESPPAWSRSTVRPPGGRRANSSCGRGVTWLR
jgi:hypothetical protein